ncbi:E3 ubiquitin-protein ligase RING1-like [Solanum pennellii]|uniref:RING-type E3 ubiquitin transferase n=1 Tax=Solanum pennellii TaxID=28526 RepID=A0ABM1V8T0_SOLPN|nr:E3 ubiquitin-protein ligase RING1-like [Solanum pennellii]
MLTFVCHSCVKTSLVKIKPIPKQKKLIIPPITSSYTSFLPYLNIEFRFIIMKRYWYIRPNDQASERVGRTLECKASLSPIVIHLSDIKLYDRLDSIISKLLRDSKNEFEDQHHNIVEQTSRKLESIMSTNEMSKVRVVIALTIDQYCDGRILLALQESSSVVGMVAASKSSIELLETIENDERSNNDDCMVCLDEIGDETQVLRLPCSHMFHAHCITKWLQNSHYCPLCRFEMPID